MESNWFVIPRQTSETKMRIFCFPYAGGNASTYSEWASKLDNSIEVIAIQLPGRANRFKETPYECMFGLITELMVAILPLLNKPYVLLGHSLGSRVAYELLQKLVLIGAPKPIHFVASGSCAPHIRNNVKPTHQLSDLEFIQTVKDMKGTPTAVLENAELMELVLPILRADFKISETHKVHRAYPIKCDATIIGGTDDNYRTSDGLTSWQDYFGEIIDIKMITGGHFFIESNRLSVTALVNKICLSSYSKLVEQKLAMS